MSLINRFFEKALPGKQAGKLQVKLSGGRHPNYLIYSEDKDLLVAIKRRFKLHNKRIWEENQPTFLPQNSDKPREYFLELTTAQMNVACKLLKAGFRIRDLEQELRNQNASFDGSHRSDKKDRLEIDLASKSEQITFQQFRDAYEKQYRSEIFTNPLSAMKRRLRQDREMDMTEIEKYADDHASSRTATVLNSLRKK
ncbi:hypothetical protein ACFORL_07030 [Legionella dresdenensis]|uniref:Uncharacterized protein n=1 Tax=Legionella dresdenensis TaxID=450200 RepID=A0ABV8CES0_9GAMM